MNYNTLIIKEYFFTHTTNYTKNIFHCFISNSSIIIIYINIKIGPYNITCVYNNITTSNKQWKPTLGETIMILKASAVSVVHTIHLLPLKNLQKAKCSLVLIDMKEQISINHWFNGILQKTSEWQHV